MWRSKWVLVIILLCNPDLPGQSLSHIGMKSGVNIARISETGTMPGKTEPVTRLIVGAFVDFEILPFLFLRYELFYSNKGTTRTIMSGDQEDYVNGGNWSFTITRRLSYLDPSMTIHFPVHQSTRTSVHIFAGASLSMNVRASSSVEGVYNGNPITNVPNNGNGFLPIDPGFIAGTGFDYDLNLFKLSVDIRYVHGLMNIWDRGAAYLPDIIRNEDDTFGAPKMHNRAVSVMLGVAI